MRQEIRSLLAIVLSLGVFVLWYFFLAPKPPAGQDTPAETDQVSSAEKSAGTEKTTVKTSDETSESSGLATKTPPETYAVATPLLKVLFTNQGGRLASVTLAGYYQSVETDAPLVDLVGESERALNLDCRYCNFNLQENISYQKIASDELSVTYQARLKDLIITRRYQVDPKRYLIEAHWTVENLSDRTLEGQLGLGWEGESPPAKSSGFLANLRGPGEQKSLAYQLAGKVERLTLEKKDRAGIEQGVIAWTGLESRYFLAGLISRQLSEQELMGYHFAGSRLGTALYYPKNIIPPKEKASGHMLVYVGPKEIGQLAAVGVGLEEAIDYGWFGWFARPILHLLKFFESFLHSWGLAIIFLTFMVKLLLNPLSIKGLKSMKAMQKLQPKLKELREKYQDDKQRLNQETMQLFKTHKVNPMGGCLPMVIQMPIYIALYKVLFSSIEIYHAPFLFYKDLAASDPYYVTPVLLGLFMLLQQKMTPQASADPMQKKMMMVMPIMFTVFMLFLPLGLIIYILVNTVMTVLQHWMYNRDLRWRDILRGRFKMA